MYFAYFDESGDAGYERSPAPAFTLAAVIVHDRAWLDTLDQLVSFRRYLRDNFGIAPRAELKAHWLIHGKGPFKNAALPFPVRMNVYRAAMRFQRKCGTIRTFAVVINKGLVQKKTVDARSWAWTRAIERLERFGADEQENIHILPDEGHGYFIRYRLRQMRRFHAVRGTFGTETLRRDATNLIEDSSDRKSHESYFVQLADLNAYAALRCVHPGSRFDGSMWDELGNSRIMKVNRLRGGPPGIVSWP